MFIALSREPRIKRKPIEGLNNGHEIYLFIKTSCRALFPIPVGVNVLTSEFTMKIVNAKVNFKTETFVPFPQKTDLRILSFDGLEEYTIN